jgi:thiol:disulfide interchange protein
MYEFSADWCGPCQMMRHDVFAQRTPASRLQAMVVPVALVDRQQEEGRNPPVVDSLQRAFKVDGFPTLVVWSPESGRSVSRSGYSGADETLRWIAQSVVEVRMAAAVPIVPNP